MSIGITLTREELQLIVDALNHVATYEILTDAEEQLRDKFGDILSPGYAQLTSPNVPPSASRTMGGDLR
ncbi:hypothetical protein [uncultured Gordonia sp.]|uniref:hypothetical protein n=1 Tax=uncultured Gordonia sp. TaxID=198437 RepID=UPI002590FEBB|nr:hypothetical protein [uncultured Gordonia sp.]